MDEDTSPSEARPSSSANDGGVNAPATVRPSLSVLPPTNSPVPGQSSSALVTPLSATGERPDRTGDAPLSASSRRQRRRVEVDTADENGARSPSATSLSGRSRSPVRYALPPPHPALLSKKGSAASLRAQRKSLTPEFQDAEGDIDSALGDDGEDNDGEDELALAVGQLSINEDEQVRYHGKASGLHLLGIQQRIDGRNEGHIW